MPSDRTVSGNPLFRKSRPEIPADQTVGGNPLFRSSRDEQQSTSREILSAQILSAQNQLHTQISALQSAGLSHGDALAQLSAQQVMLASLQKKLGSADPKELTAISALIAGAVAAAQGIAQQAQVGTTSARSSQIALEEACEASRKVTNDFVREFYDHHEFDKYLKFSSATDEDEYHKREEERHKAIEEALARHTPQGTLEANRLAIEQLKDAGAHGADKSPDYKPTLEGLQNSGAELARGIRESGDKTKSTSAEATAAKLPSDLLASLAASKVAMGDDANKGHGLVAALPAATSAKSI